MLAAVERRLARLGEIEPMRRRGRVARVAGLIAECEGASLPIGALVEIRATNGKTLRGEVVGFREDRTLIMPLGDLQGVARFDPVTCLSASERVPVGESLRGRVINSNGEPVDGGEPIRAEDFYPIYAPAPDPVSRPPIREPLSLGVRAIDGMTTCGKGQRMGLFSGSGVGKSVLMGMVARNTTADVTVIALVGERGREVREFIDKVLGEEGRRRAVVVVETSDRPALRRTRAPFAATAVAEFFRSRGADVLLLMDSLTRMALAQREIGLSAGEPPTTRGYPPSVFAMMPKLLERAGRTPRGSITGIYTVLVEGDDMNEPISDHARSILDGHVWLSRDLAHRGRYPAVDALASISRLMIDVVDKDFRQAATRLRAVLAVYADAEDLINVGAYVKGSSPEIDTAIRMHPKIVEFLKQEIAERAVFDQTAAKLKDLAKEIDPK